MGLDEGMNFSVFLFESGVVYCSLSISTSLSNAISSLVSQIQKKK